MNSSPNKPDVFRFTSRIVRHSDGDRLHIPQDVARKLKTLDKLEGRINSQSFRAPILRDSEGVWLRVNTAMMRGSLAAYGETVSVAVLGPEPHPVPQTDFHQELILSPEAMTSWESLTVLGKRDWIRWIDDTNNPKTRARRIARAIEQLSDGKRRACCVNVNGFMECRIKEYDGIIDK